MYDASQDGAFHFDNKTQAEFDTALTAWSVPDKLKQQFDAAALTSSADFKTFDLTVNGTVGSFEAHVGSVRKDPNTNLIYFGYVWGSAAGHLITPMVRTDVHTGDCHGTQRGMSPRGFNAGEIALINQGMQAYAFTKAANECV